MRLFRQTVVRLAVNTVVHITAAILGFGIAGLGAILLMNEMKGPVVHSGHIYLFAGFLFFGALLVAPSVVVSGLQRVVVIVGPFIPGGRRATDPPAISPIPDGKDTTTRPR